MTVTDKLAKALLAVLTDGAQGSPSRELAREALKEYEQVKAAERYAQEQRWRQGLSA